MEGNYGTWINRLRETSDRHVWLSRALTLARLDLDASANQPSGLRVLAATGAAVAASLLADAVLVTVGEAVFPSTRGYPHFEFSDYAKLTVIGVLIACAAWPVVTRITSSPRWMFSRMAVAVTLVLWLPDLYILAQGQPAKAVAVLMVMHLAIALVTYHLLVHIARCASSGSGCQVGIGRPGSAATARSSSSAN